MAIYQSNFAGGVIPAEYFLKIEIHAGVDLARKLIIVAEPTANVGGRDRIIV